MPKLTVAFERQKRQSPRMFTWIPLYREIAQKILEFENRQDELLSLLRSFSQNGLQIGALEDEDAQGGKFPLAEIDPFTFFATFNWQGRRPENRRAILSALRDAWQLSAELPDDFEGIPLGNPQNLWLFSFKKYREDGDIPRLWQLARQIVEGTRATVDHILFGRIQEQRNIGEVNLSVGMFWLNPKEFLPADKWTRGYMERQGVHQTVWNGDAYFNWLEECVKRAGTDFPKISHAAFVEKQPSLGAVETLASTEKPRIWIFAPGAGARDWEWMRDNGVIAIGWTGLGDLRGFSSKGEIVEKLGLNSKGQRQTNNGKACWDFPRSIRLGDVVVVKTGTGQIIGYGVVTGDYEFHEGEDYEHRRTTEWKSEGDWSLEGLPVKTLTEAAKPSFIAQLSEVVGADLLSLTAAPQSASLLITVPFTRDDALAELFMDSAQLETILARLTRKKGIILQGAPGVGKTFVARRLAYALMAEQDDSRVCMVQFHPSYGYEDFIQGYRPDGSGLRLQNGVFYKFAEQARLDPRPHFFVIDEINRGNLAKIFGELLMLLEADKRGRDFAVPLTYAEDLEDTFWLPENLYVIGTMNTADRSLAMVDYALRRRFAFVTLAPALDRPEFHTWLAEKGAPPALVARIAQRVGSLNAEISTERDLGPGFRIGHSYFCPSDAPADWEAWYEDIIDAEIAPLLEEYFDKNTRVQELTDALLA